MLSPHKPQDTKQHHDQQGKADECDGGADRGAVHRSPDVHLDCKNTMW